MKLKQIIAVVLCAVFIVGCASTKGFVKNPQGLRAIKKVAVLPFVCNSRDIGYAISEALSACFLA
jgi:hypothetical protein